jgi:pre-mRNA-splicing factor SYF1
MWLDLCDLITKHPDETFKMNVENVIRGALTSFKDEVGRLWTALADYFILLGNFEKAPLPP